MGPIEPIEQPAPFRTCSKCGATWDDREAFLSDPGIELIGYQVHFKDLETGLFLFNHSCRTTLAVRAGMFTDLHNGPIFVDRLAGGNSCPEYCLREKCLFTCPAECECAYVRDVLQIVRTWPKHQRESPP